MPDWEERVLPFPSWTVWLLAAVSLIFFLFKTPLLTERLFCPIQVQQGDAITLERASLLAQGQSLYVPSDQRGPYLYAAYPPLFFELTAILTRFVPNPWMPARILALVGFIGIGLLFGVWFGTKKGWAWGFLACSLFWLFPTWTRWSTTDRVDELYIFLNFAAFLLLYRDWKREKTELGMVALAGFLNATAILMKQSAFNLTVVYLLSCLLILSWKRLFVFALVSLSPVFSFFAYEEGVTQGYFLKHTFFWLHTGYHLDLFFKFFFNEFTPENGWLVILVLLFLLLKRQSLLLVLQLGMVSFEVFSLGREGGAENYWLNFSVFALFFALESLDLPERVWVQGRFKMALGWSVMLLLAVGIFHGGFDRSLQVPGSQEIAMKKEAASFFSPGECLAIDTDIAVLAGKRIWIQPAEYAQMVRLRTWETEPLIKDIEAKKFNSIEVYDLAQQYFLPDDVMDAIRRNYHLSVRKYGRVWLVANRT